MSHGPETAVLTTLGTLPCPVLDRDGSVQLAESDPNVAIRTE
jgi:hypothetical protein